MATPRPKRSAIQEAKRHLILSAGPGLIALGLIANGADDASSASLLSCGLLLVLLFVLGGASAERIVHVLQRNRIASVAALVFCIWTAFTALRFESNNAPQAFSALFHPAWADLLAGAYGAISISPYRTLEGLASLLGAIAAFAIGASIVIERSDRARVGRLLCVFAAGFSLYALIQYFGVQDGHARLHVNFSSANSAAALFGIFCLLHIAMIYEGMESRKRRPLDAGDALSTGLALSQTLFAVIGLALALCGLMLTGSRAGLVVTLLAIATMVTLIAVRRPFNPTRLKVLGVILLILAPLALGGLRFALDRGLFDDAARRALILDAHWDAFLARPFIGHGMNSFHALNLLYSDAEHWRGLYNLGAAHNIYLQTLEETGLVGLAALALMLAGPLWRALRNALSNRPSRIWASAAFAGFMLALIHGLVDFTLQTPAIAALLCFMLGLANAPNPFKPKPAPVRAASSAPFQGLASSKIAIATSRNAHAQL